MHIFKIYKGFEITSSLHKMLWPWLFINIHYPFIIYLSLYFSFIKSTRFLAIHCLILAWLISDQYMYNLFIPLPLSCFKIYTLHTLQIFLDKNLLTDYFFMHCLFQHFKKVECCFSYRWSCVSSYNPLTVTKQ